MQRRGPNHRPFSTPGHWAMAVGLVALLLVPLSAVATPASRASAPQTELRGGAVPFATAFLRSHRSGPIAPPGGPSGARAELRPAPLSSTPTPHLIDNVSLGASGNDAGWGIVYNSENGLIYATFFEGPSVTVIDPSSDTVVTRIGTGGGPFGAVYDSGKNEVFVADYGSNQVTVIRGSNNTVAATINVGNSPTDVAYDNRTGEVFVANEGGRTLSVINDTNDSLVTNITVGSNPWGVAYDWADREIFTSTESDGGNLTAISDSTDRIVRNVTTNVSLPKGLGYDPVTDTIWVAGAGYGIMIYDARTYAYVTTLVPFNYTSEFTYDPAENAMFVTNVFAGSLQGFNASSYGQLWNVPDLDYPWAVAVAPSVQTAFVVQSNGNGVGVIDLDLGSQQSFNAVGLPNGTEWWISGGFGNFTSRSSYLDFYLPSGNYSAQAGAMDGYGCDPSAFTLDVTAVSADWGIFFDELFPVSVQENGLFHGVPWTISFEFTGADLPAIVFNETASTATIGLANGSYTYQASVLGSEPFTPVAGGSGSVNISAHSTSLSVVFGELYPVTFSETGLDPGATWGIRTTQALPTVTVASNGTSPAVPTTATNGTVSFRVIAPVGTTATPNAGSIPITGRSADQPIVFRYNPTVSELWFNETGLGAGLAWTVVVDGVGKFPTAPSLNHSTGPSVLFQFPINYTGFFTVRPVTGFTATPDQGSIAVPSSNGTWSESIRFVANGTHSVLGSGGGPSTDLLLAAGIGAGAVIVVVVAVLLGRGRRPAGPAIPEEPTEPEPGAG